MTIIDILSATLVGKQIPVLKYEFKNTGDLNVVIRLFFNNADISPYVHKDPRFTFVGTVNATIISVDGSYDKYEGDNINITVEESGRKELFSITSEDKIEFLNN
jgi:hypothetical protein